MSISSQAEQALFDDEGFMFEPLHWNTTIAEQIAQREGIEMSPAHWEIITLARQFYEEFDLSPNPRPLANYIKQKLGEDKAKSMYLMKLFSSSPAKFVSKIAGLPKPTHCI